MNGLARWMLTAALGLGAGASRAAAQCAMCQASSASGIDGGASYNSSTLFMLCTPYLLLLAGAGYVAYAYRRSRRSADAAPDSPKLGGNPGPSPSAPASEFGGFSPEPEESLPQ
jgi:hypothetical protein